MNAISNPSPTTFEAFWQLGYQHLLPIIPPTADIRPTSSLYGRVGTSQDSRGKAVGVRGMDGLWSGFDWRNYTADLNDLKRWTAMAAGVGIRTGQGLILIDADTLDKQHAGIILQTITNRLGVLPCRIESP